MKLQFYKSKQTDGSIKATVHFNGRLGFSASAAKLMQLLTGTLLKIANNEEDKDTGNLYIVKVDKPDEETYRVVKAGSYYYLNAKLLFDELGVDYKGKKVIYDIQEITYMNDKIYKLNRRVRDRRKKHKF